MAASVEVVTRADQGPFGQRCDGSRTWENEHLMTGVHQMHSHVDTGQKVYFHGLRKTFKSWASLMTDSGHYENPMLRMHGLAGHLPSWLAEWFPGQNSASFGPSCP